MKLINLTVIFEFLHEVHSANFSFYFKIYHLNLKRYMSQSNQQAVSDLKDKVYSREQYARASFWEDRYVENGGFFDWYAQFPELKLAFRQYGIVEEDKILMVGCGNSKLSDQMYQNGYKNIVNIDISPTVINQMKEKFPYMTWEVMDATKMTYQNGEFDVILDKGTLDALISGKCFDICESMLKQCMRVTKESGQIIIITYGSPEGRRKIFETALTFDEYDYYQCRAELNDLSTMINLMRSNLPGQQLSGILKQQEAFAKTMKEFSIIKMLRRSRKNQKQYIVWNKYQKAELQVNNSHIKAEKPQQKLVIKTQESSKTEQKPAEKQSFNYQPKKQPYVFVYSIRRKFTLGFEEILEKETEQSLHNEFSKNEQGDFHIKGNSQHQQSISFLLQQNLKTSALRALKFLQNKHLSVPSVLITSSLQKLLEGSLKINIIESKSPNVLCIRKTNFNLIITLNPRAKVQLIIQQFGKLVRKLKEKCSLHPSPKTYALFGVLKNRKLLPTVNELLDKYWYPTWRINSIANGQLNLQFSIPPILQQKQKDIFSVIENHFKPNKVQITKVRQGFISYIDLELFNIVSMACVSYASERATLITEEFWQEDEISSRINSTKYVQNPLYNELPQTLFLGSQTLQKVIAHIIGLY